MPQEGDFPFRFGKNLRGKFIRKSSAETSFVEAIVQSWRRVWEQVIPFFAYPKEIRKIIYTTNAIESLHMQLRKVLKNRGLFPSNEAATKLIYLVLRNITKKWKKPSIT